MNADRKNIVFCTWEGGGNIPPVMTLVRRLVARGHAVRWLGDACTRADAEAAGALFVSWRPELSRLDRTPASDTMRDWEAGEPAEVLRRIVERYMCGTAEQYARDVAAELDRERCDLIVTSEMLLGPMVAAEARAVPVVALGCNIPIVPLPGVPPFGPGLAPARDAAERAIHAEVATALDGLLAEGLAPLNRARAAFGLEPVEAVGAQFARLDRYMAATAEAFDFPADRLPPNLAYVGPLLDEPHGTLPWSDPWPPAERPLVLVAFSTTFQDQVDHLQRVIDALATLAADAVVTTGPAIDPGELRAPPHVAVRASAPHDELMRRAAVVVTHAGHGTVMRALLAGVPLLCMPMGRDQNDNSARVVARGAGLALPASAGVGEIHAALVRLLSEPEFAAAAATLGRAIAAETDPDHVADLLADLAGNARQSAGEELRHAASPLSLI